MTAFLMSSIGIAKKVALFGDSKGTYARVRKFFYYAHLPSVEGVAASVKYRDLARVVYSIYQ